ncbi:PerC family transcriptional regulator [Enterobacter mori]|uniref:PerC family transcriptional regulator n=1 Tax=Enterobacter mori TaxID=539813 RepID=UPI003B83E22A
MTEPMRVSTINRLTDSTAERLENRGFWRRAARRWLDVLDNAISEKLREAAALRRNYCQRMAAGVQPDTRYAEM